MIIEPRFFDEYQIGEERSTVSRTVTETDIVLHAGQSGDFYPDHMDKEWVKTQPIKQRIAHGTLTFSMGIGLTAGIINPHAMTKGYDKLRFIKPVYIGDTIRSTLKIIDKNYKEGKWGSVFEEVKVFNQKDELVLYCIHIIVVNIR